MNPLADEQLALHERMLVFYPKAVTNAADLFTCVFAEGDVHRCRGRHRRLGN